MIRYAAIPAGCPRIVALDVDGTLVGRDGVPADVWPALARARARGVRLGLCTGRLLAGRTAELAHRVDPEGIHVSQSGAVLTGPRGEVVWSAALEPAVVLALADLAGPVGADLEVYWHDGFGVGMVTDAVTRHAAHLGVPVRYIDPNDVPTTVTSAVWLVPDARWPVAQAALRELPAVQVAPATTPWAPGLVFANLTAPGVSKGWALARVADHLAVPLSRVAMVGDGENDLDALQTAGTAVVMASAPAAVRAVADLVVSDVDEGGLVAALAGLIPDRVPRRLPVEWRRNRA